MNFIVDFYKNLDTINLIIFWGVIIVILLLLIFAIIISNKNKKLKAIIESNKIDLDLYNNHDLAIKEEIDDDLNKQNTLENNLTNNILDIKNTEPVQNDVVESKKFIAEEHVIEYNNELFTLPNIKNNHESKEEKPAESKPKEIIIPTVPYQRNVLREMSLSQTSPIGIVKKETKKDIENAEELNQLLNKSSQNKEDETNKNNLTKDNILDIKNTKYQGDYLKEVSKKLEEAKNSEDTFRTEYELKQEEDAIISYEELMQKKDSLKMVDEEEAVISIDELIERKKQQDHIYNITEQEQNDKFISELKHFRNDL